MQTLKKIIVFPFMTYFFLVHVSLIVILILVYFGILVEIFIPQLYVLENFLELLNTLGAEGVIGLLVIAQFFINYYLFIFTRRIYKNIKT